MSRINVIYARVSTKNQAQDGHSITQQIDLCTKAASLFGIEIHNVICDEGYSATSLNRPGIRRIRTLIKNETLGTLIITSLDRLSRNIVNTAKLFDEIDKHGCKIQGVLFDASRRTADERLVMNLLSVISQSESEKTSERTVNGLIGSLKDGYYPFPSPYGYTRDAVVAASENVEGKLKRKIKYKLVPNEEELQTIKIIFQMYADYCMSTRSISKSLIKEDPKLTESKVRLILRDSRYTGVLKYRGESYTGFFQPTIGKILFEQVQSVLDSKKIKTTVTYLYKGKLICKSCNNPLVCTHSQSRGVKYKYYSCNNKACTCFKSLVSEKKVTTLIEPMLVALWQSNQSKRTRLSNLKNLQPIEDDSINDLSILREETLRKFINHHLEKHSYDFVKKTLSIKKDKPNE